MKPRLSIFSAPRGLGRVFSEQNQINVKFLEASIPFSDTTGNVALNFGGKIRIIVVQGAHDGEYESGADQDAKLKSFIDVVDDWVNANIQVSQFYYDSFGSEYVVKAVDWTWTRSMKDPSRVLYTLILKQSVA